MSHFSTALSQVLDRSFDGKQLAMAAQAGMQTSDISRLVREDAPLTPQKLEKLLLACAASPDRTLLVHAAVRDFIGDEQYLARFAPKAKTGAESLTESLGGPVFQSLFPLSARAEQVLRYIINRAGHDSDLSKMLELMGNFLELPAPEPGADVEQAIDDVTKEISSVKSPVKKGAKYGKSA